MGKENQLLDLTLSFYLMVEPKLLHIPEKPNTQNINQHHLHTNLSISQPLHQPTKLPQPLLTSQLLHQPTNLPQPLLISQPLPQPINPLQPLLQPQPTNPPQNQSTHQLQLQLKLQRSTINQLQHQRHQRSTTSQYPTTSQRCTTRMLLKQKCCHILKNNYLLMVR